MHYVATGQPEIEAALDVYAADAELPEDDSAHAQLERPLGKVDLKEAWLRHFYGGFDNYEDYVRYGDAFEEVVPSGLVRRPAASGSR